MLTGALSGGLAATGVGLLGQVAGNAILGAASSAYGQYKSADFNHFNVKGIVIDGIVGGISGAIGGRGVGTKHLNNLGKQSLKRTSRAILNTGFKNTLREVKKSSKYYLKNASYVYPSLSRGIIKSTAASTGYNLFDDAYSYIISIK